MEKKLLPFAFLTLGLTLASANPKNSSKSKRGISSESSTSSNDELKFNGAPLGVLPVPNLQDDQSRIDLAASTFVNQLRPKDAESRADYAKVPEPVRAIRDAARVAELAKSQHLLYQYVVKQRSELPENFNYDEVLKRNAEILTKVLLIEDNDTQTEQLDALFIKNPELKDALTYLGVVSVFCSHGDFSKAPENIQRAHAIDFNFHHFDVDSSRDNPSRFVLLNRSINIGSESFKYSAETPAVIESTLWGKRSIGPALRRIGLALVWDLRDVILPTTAGKINEQLAERMKVYVPYDRVYLDTFKQNAFAEGSPEFLAIWRSVNSPKKYRRELIAVGLVTTAKRKDSVWELVGQRKGAEGNTPDGIYKLFGYDKHYHSEVGNYDMRGMVQFTYSEDQAFIGRGFHLLKSGSCWGGPGSHGCIRVATSQGDAGGLAAVIWATINPLQLDAVDTKDFGDSGVNVYSESPFAREIVRAMRERVYISTFSEYAEGYRIFGSEEYTARIHNEYENFRSYTGIDLNKAAKKFMAQKQTIVGPSSNRSGQYWVYDAAIRAKAFEMDFGSW